MKNLILPLVFSIAVFVYAVRSLVHIVTTSAPDFSHFYWSARDLLAGINMYHDTTLFTQLGYPPPSVLPLLPFTLLSYPIAQGIWVIGSYVVLWVCVFLCLRLTKQWSLKRFLVIGSLAFLSFPTKFTLGMGQRNLYALLLVLAALATKKESVAGLLIGAAVLVKPQLSLVLVPWYLLGSRRVFWCAVGIVLMATAATGIIFGWEQFAPYLGEVVPKLLSFSGRDVYYNQSISAIFSRLLPGSTAFWLTEFLSLGIVMVTVIVTVKHRLRLFEAVALMLATLLLVAPISWQHHFVFLLPLLVWLWFRTKRALWSRVGLVAAYLLVSWNIKDPQAMTGYWFSPILLSHVFVGGIIGWFIAIQTLWS